MTTATRHFDNSALKRRIAHALFTDLELYTIDPDEAERYKDSFVKLLAGLDSVIDAARCDVEAEINRKREDDSRKLTSLSAEYLASRFPTIDVRNLRVSYQSCGALWTSDFADKCTIYDAEGQCLECAHTEEYKDILQVYDASGERLLLDQSLVASVASEHSANGFRVVAEDTLMEISSRGEIVYEEFFRPGQPRSVDVFVEFIASLRALAYEEFHWGAHETGHEYDYDAVHQRIYQWFDLHLESLGLLNDEITLPTTTDTEEHDEESNDENSWLVFNTYQPRKKLRAIAHGDE